MREIKSFEDVWQFPFKRFHSKVMDKNNNMVLDFMHPYLKGMFNDKEIMVISDEQKDDILKILNGEKKGTIESLVHDGGMILKDNKVLMLIRGWGYLTGIGGLYLKAEKAMTLQDELANFILSKLNSEQELKTERRK